jgi:hypothetical protein
MTVAQRRSVALLCPVIGMEQRSVSEIGCDNEFRTATNRQPPLAKFSSGLAAYAF